MSTYILKEIHKEICEPLAIIFNKCVEQGVFPNPLTVGRVALIYKKGDIESCENYRPISILPAVSKICFLGGWEAKA